ncbi:alpha/beta-hydrolase [Agrocybe pediades]|nr:alpha/beta-hydrolase [Agrocybe pediades]
MKARQLEPVVDEIEGEARLLWIGPKVTARVILVFHGGAFIFGMVGSLPDFWYHVQEKLEDKGKRVGIALLDYTLVPEGKFPTQLRQAVAALQYLLDSGVKPEDLQLAGDSAGAVLIHQLWSHLLHPLDGVPKVHLSAPLAGAYLMSPWASMRDNPLFYTNMNTGDLIDVPIGLYWASIVLDGIPPALLPYIEANSSPEGWLEGVDMHVKRVLFSIGTAELLRDTALKYAKMVETHHRETVIFMQEGGVHVDPYLPFLVQEKKLGTVTPFLIDWLDQNFL